MEDSKKIKYDFQTNFMPIDFKHFYYRIDLNLNKYELSEIHSKKSDFNNRYETKMIFKLK